MLIFLGNMNSKRQIGLYQESFFFCKKNLTQTFDFLKFRYFLKYFLNPYFLPGSNAGFIYSANPSQCPYLIPGKKISFCKKLCFIYERNTLKGTVEVFLRNPLFLEGHVLMPDSRVSLKALTDQE